MEKISSIEIDLETADDVEFVEGEEISNLHMSEAASGIKIQMTTEEGEVTKGYPWGSVKSFTFMK